MPCSECLLWEMRNGLVGVFGREVWASQAMAHGLNVEVYRDMVMYEMHRKHGQN